ncbi:MAG TPA: DNA polymerase III subunit delta [Candidatus Angelobacter sp.]|nr:DNA polymerase III subunit delta [Candidatus Angelobacter sp.]
MPAITDQLSIKTPLQPIYLLQGTQDYLIKYVRKKIVELAVLPEDRDLNLSVYDLNETPIELAIEDAMTLPFLGDKKVIVLINPSFLTGEAKKQKVEHHLDEFLTYISEPSPDTILVIEAPYEKLDKRKKIVKSLESGSQTFSLNQLSEESLFQLLKDEGQSLNAIYTKGAHDRLLALVGFNVAQLVNEIHKLALYVGDQREIKEEDVEVLATRSLESNVFDLVNHVLKRRADLAIQLLQDLFKQKQEPIRLLALITRQVRIMLQTLLYQKQGYTQKEIASRLKLHPYAVKIAAELGRTFQPDQLKQTLIWCSDTDYGMKTGREEKEVALQLLIHRIASL